MNDRPRRTVRASRAVPIARARVLAGAFAGALVAWAATACGKTENVTPSDVVVQFYVTLEVSGVRDLPEPRALVALEPYLTDSLASQLRLARQRRDSAGVASPGEKPPLADGNPFSSLFEGHSTYVVRGAVTRADSTFVTVAFTNTEQQPAVSWSDTLVLVKAGPAAGTNAAPVWRIADIRYGGNWEFGYRGSLQQVLRGATAPAPDR